jgi:uncharacterized membrane protein
MSKQQINRKETQVATNEGVGKQLEQTLTIEDSALPSPQELTEYKKIDPRIVDLLISMSKSEQAHRHATEKMKLKILRRAEGRDERTNWWGMFFAFSSIFATMVLSGWALYLNRPWFAGILGSLGLVTIVSIFVNKGGGKK